MFEHYELLDSAPAPLWRSYALKSSEPRQAIFVLRSEQFAIVTYAESEGVGTGPIACKQKAHVRWL